MAGVIKWRPASWPIRWCSRRPVEVNALGGERRGRALQGLAAHHAGARERLTPKGCPPPPGRIVRDLLREMVGDVERLGFRMHRQDFEAFGRTDRLDISLGFAPTGPLNLTTTPIVTDAALTNNVFHMGSSKVRFIRQLATIT